MEISDFKETISNVAETVKTKSSEIFETTKIKFALSDAEGEVSKLIYESYKSGEEPGTSLNEICEAIDAKYKEIEEMRTKLRVYKNISVCPECGAEVSSESVFCSKCGAKLTE